MGLINVPGSATGAETLTIDFSDPIFKTAATSVTKTIQSFTSSRTRLVGATVSPQVEFAGTGITALTCSLGSSTSGNADIYTRAVSAMQVTKDESVGGLFNGRDLVTPDSSLDVVATFSCTGANFGNGSATNLTSGKIWITLVFITLPSGS